MRLALFPPFPLPRSTVEMPGFRLVISPVQVLRTRAPSANEAKTRERARSFTFVILERGAHGEKRKQKRNVTSETRVTLDWALCSIARRFALLSPASARVDRLMRSFISSDDVTSVLSCLYARLMAPITPIVLFSGRE